MTVIVARAIDTDIRSQITSRNFSSAPLKRKMTGCFKGLDFRDNTSRTSRATATLTPSSLAPVKMLSESNFYLNNMFNCIDLPGLPVTESK